MKPVNRTNPVSKEHTPMRCVVIYTPRAIIHKTLVKTKPVQFLQHKCAESDAWANVITALGIGAIIGIALL